MLLHEDPPFQVQVVVVSFCDAALQTRALNIERAIILEKGVNFRKELIEIAESCVLGHLNRTDHVETFLRKADIVEVRVDDFYLVPMVLVQAPCVIGSRSNLRR